MKKNRLYSLSVLVIGVLISVSLLPFRIHAQSLTSPFLGINMQVTAYGENASSITLPKINIEYIGSTVPSGYISGQLNCTTPSTPSSSTPCDVFQFQNTSGQSGTGNGTRIYLNLQNYLLEANGNATINHQSYFFIDYEFILDDNYKGYVTFTDSDNNTKTVYVNGNQFHYSRMQLSISEVTITIDEYELTRVTDSLIWGFPIESLPFINQVFKTLGDNIDYSLTSFSYYTYPYIKPLNNIFYDVYLNTNRRIYFVVMLDQSYIYSQSTLQQLININNSNLTMKFQSDNIDSPMSLLKFYIENTSGSTQRIRMQFNRNIEFIPIYAYNVSNLTNKKYGPMNQDFIETFDMINYKQSSDNLDNIDTQFQNESNSLISIEDSFNNSMNNALQNVSPTFNMGQSFLNSANWVSSQFNRIVNNTPFASLITFGLTLGLGLLIIGKVRK